MLCLGPKVGNIEMLCILLSEERGMDINAECDPSDKSSTHIYGGIALHWAGALGGTDSVEFLISREARKDIRNGVGMTPKDAAIFLPFFKEA